MKRVTIYLKGWRDSALFADAVNNPRHELHAEAEPVFHRSFRPYAEGDLVYRAFDYTDDAPDAEDLIVCERAFRWFNEGDNPIVRKYRAAGNRSLSVGDVVVVEGRAYGVGSFGWDRIETFEPKESPR